MLLELYIKNFAIIKSCSVSLKTGMTTITGDTGAGKSILLEALNIILGGRVDKNSIRALGPAEFTGIFDTSNIPLASKMLYESGFLSEKHENQCIIRRIFRSDGRNKSFINDKPVTVGYIKDLSQYIMSIYSQHAHQDLFSTSAQLERLDSYAGHDDLIQYTESSYAKMQYYQKKIDECNIKKNAQSDRMNLLIYQLEELRQLGLSENELTALHAKQKQLSSAQSDIDWLTQCYKHLYSDNVSSISVIELMLSQMAEKNTKDWHDLKNNLNQACIFLHESIAEIKFKFNEIENQSASTK